MADLDDQLHESGRIIVLSKSAVSPKWVSISVSGLLMRYTFAASCGWPSGESRASSGRPYLPSADGLLLLARTIREVALCA
jgi:hypothetical protein